MSSSPSPAALASAIASEALRLRGTHPSAPAAAILDLVAKGRSAVDLVAAAEVASAGPASPFGALLTEALDPCMSPMEWSGLIKGALAPEAAAAMHAGWKTEVIERFLAKYVGTLPGAAPRAPGTAAELPR